MSGVSITDIARVAGVSPSTVSRALQDHPRISPERRAAIQALARQMGYQPSQVARSLVTGRTQTLGVVVTDVSDPFVAGVLAGAESAARAAGYTLLFATSHHDPGRELEAARLLAGRQVDGMLVISSRGAGQYRELPRRGVAAADDSPQARGHGFAAGSARGAAGEAGLPVVLVNNDQPGPRLYSVRMANRAGAALAVAYLRGLGHRRIAFLAGPAGGRSSEERLEGYRQGLRGHPGVEGAGQPAEEGSPAGDEGSEELPARIISGRGQLEDGPQALAALLALPAPPTAVLCYNDLAAVGLLSAAHAAGLRVPGDLSVVGYDNLPLSAFTIPPLTTVSQPTQRMGQEAVALCLAVLAGKPASDVVLTGELILRGSAGPAPSARSCP